MLFVDTHSHYCDEMFEGCADAAIERAVNAGVSKMIQADIDSREREAMFALVRRHPGVLYPMLGLYPGSVGPDWREEIDKMLAFPACKVVAIGEIGLDYHYSAETAAIQKEAFRVQLELAAQMNLPVNIHLREATEDFFAVVSDCKHLGLRGNIHAFSASWEVYDRLSRLGDWYVGIGGVITFKKSKLPEAVARIPLDRIILETDAPYLAPTPHRGELNESSYIPLIAAKVAEVKGVSIEEVANVTTATATNLFNL